MEVSDFLIEAYWEIALFLFFLSAWLMTLPKNNPLSFMQKEIKLFTRNARKKP